MSLIRTIGIAVILILVVLVAIRAISGFLLPLALLGFLLWLLFKP